MGMVTEVGIGMEMGMEMEMEMDMKVGWRWRCRCRCRVEMKMQIHLVSSEYSPNILPRSSYSKCQLENGAHESVVIEALIFVQRAGLQPW